MMRRLRNRAIFAKLAVWFVGIYFFAPTFHLLSEEPASGAHAPIAGMCAADCKLPTHHHPTQSHDSSNCPICHSLSGFVATVAYTAMGHSETKVAWHETYASVPPTNCAVAVTGARGPPSLLFVDA
jgi:hypothetical protein